MLEAKRVITGNSDIFSREELGRIIQKANSLSGLLGLNSQWRRVYQDLAQAASTLDAFIARSMASESTSPATTTTPKKMEMTSEQIQEILRKFQEETEKHPQWPQNPAKYHPHPDIVYLGELAQAASTLK